MLSKKGLGSESLRGALQCVVAGGCWPRVRLHIEGIVDSPLCLACSSGGGGVPHPSLVVLPGH
eukprot:148656-Lingulodinium_polyedra.AAC.1